jgi:hypothetical protein
MKKVTRLAALVLTWSVIAPAAADAQAIVGTVRDVSGAVLPGVTVEASSPALIEKARSVVSSGTGQYAIEDLRPGTYTVTFALPGFSMVKREGIELTTNFVATVNGDMKVGGVSETVTVTGETPIVDVASSRTQTTLSGQTVAEIPSSRLYSALTQLVPALNVQGNDVGGAQGNVFSVFQIHGGRRNEGQVQIDGMSIGYQGMGVSSYVAEVGNAQEVNFTLAGGLGEAVTGGPQMNIIGKQGGNTFAGSFFINGTGNALQGTNLTDDLKARGLKSPQSLQKAWDINPSFGGPIIRDRLWFFGTYRYQINLQNVASMWENLNAGDPTKWTYLPADGNGGRPLQQAVDDGRWKNESLRLTWQPTPRNKINGWMDVQHICLHCTDGGSSSGLTFTGLIASREGLPRNENHPNMMSQISWTSPVTSRLLLEANAQLGPYFWWGSRMRNPWDATMIPVQDDAGLIPGINYRSANWSGHSGFTNIVQGSVSHVTGSHTAKFGARYHANDSKFPTNFYNDAQLKYNFRNGVPYQFTMYLDQAPDPGQHQGFVALYAQDRWTINRLTLQGGLRFEHLADHYPRQQLGPNRFLPTALVFPEQDGPLKQKELMPRFGIAYDVFGNGRTATKFFLGRYVTTTNTVEAWLNYSPAGAGHVATSQNRSWSDLNGNFVPDCNLLDPKAQSPTTTGSADTCGAGNPFFGKPVFPLTIDPATTDGWNTREYSWDLTAGVTQQVGPRVSVELDYVRRSWGNLQITVNRALTPADFDPFVYTVPQDSRLPNGGGYSLTYYDIKPGKFNQFDNLRTFSDSVGGAFNHFNGVDFSVNARMRRLTVQGGFSTGNNVEDECGVAAQHPDIYISSFGWGGSFVSLAQRPQVHCHRESGWQTNVKGLATYNVPKADVLISATFHSVPYPGANFPSVTSQSLGGVALIAPQTQTNLGRPLSSGNPFEFVNIVTPGTKYGDRLTAFDLRFGKNLRFGRTRTLVALDIFNVANSNAPDVYQQNYGAAYLNPLSITQARLMKISAQLDF